MNTKKRTTVTKEVAVAELGPIQTETRMPASATHTLSPEALVAQAIDRGMTVDTIERLLAMRKDLRAEHAKSQYDKAMSALQGEMPVIIKTKIVRDKHGKERYRYAPIDSIVEQVRGIIAVHGFSYSVTTEQAKDAEEVMAICSIKHTDGHCEQSTFRVPIDREAYMSGPQKVGAALTFAKRYAFSNAFGIITGDDDTDAVKDDDERPAGSSTKTQTKPVPAVTLVTREQIERLLAAVAAYGMPQVNLELWLKKSVDDLTETKALELTVAFEKKVADGQRYQPKLKDDEGPKDGGEPEQPTVPAPVTHDPEKTKAVVAGYAERIAAAPTVEDVRRIVGTSITDQDVPLNVDEEITAIGEKRIAELTGKAVSAKEPDAPAVAETKTAMATVREYTTQIDAAETVDEIRNIVGSTALDKNVTTPVKSMIDTHAAKRSAALSEKAYHAEHFPNG